MAKRLYGENGRYAVDLDRDAAVVEAEKTVKALVMSLAAAGYDVRDVGSILSDAVSDGVLDVVLT